jgi:MFS family permease
LLGVGLAALPAMIITGRLAERAGPRLVSITLVAFAAAGVLPALAGSPWALFALMLVLGAASGALDVAREAVAGRVAPPSCAGAAGAHRRLRAGACVSHRERRRELERALRAAGRLGAGPAISTVAVLGYLGFTIGPPLIGGVTAASGFRGGFAFLAAASALLVATAPILRRLG